MLHKVLDGREVIVFGKNYLEVRVAYCDLSLGSVNISAYVYHKIDGIKLPGFDVKDFKEYASKSDKYYIVVADNDNYAEIREVLIAGGYAPVKDFIHFRPITYVKSRTDLTLEI